MQRKTRTRIQIYEYQPVGNVKPNDPNLTENSWTEEEFDGEEALSPQRMPCMLTMAHPVVQTTSGAGPSTIKEGNTPVASRTRAASAPQRPRKSENSTSYFLQEGLISTEISEKIRTLMQYYGFMSIR